MNYKTKNEGSIKLKKMNHHDIHNTFHFISFGMKKIALERCSLHIYMTQQNGILTIFVKLSKFCCNLCGISCVYALTCSAISKGLVDRKIYVFEISLLVLLKAYTNKGKRIIRWNILFYNTIFSNLSKRLTR